MWGLGMGGCGACVGRLPRSWQGWGEGEGAGVMCSTALASASANTYIFPGLLLQPPRYCLAPSTSRGSYSSYPCCTTLGNK